MKPLAYNTAAFFLIYAPLTLFFGLFLDAYRVAGANEAAGYEIFLWFVVFAQLLAPTLMLFISICFAIRILGKNWSTIGRRVVLVCAIGLLLPAFQGFVWAGDRFSLTWAAVAVLPALILGGITRLPNVIRQP